MTEKYAGFEEFWPFYLSEHSNRTCRRLHFFGTTVAALLLVLSLVLGHPLAALGAIAVGYAFSWIGHFFFERNRPATFRFPAWSFRGDMRMYAWMLIGRIPF